MKLHRLYGHAGAAAATGRAIAQGRLPQAIVLHGPAGVGKQRFAIWAAQVMLCEAGEPTPCKLCQSCQMVDNLAHPDLHWFVPLVPRKRTGSAAKQVEETAEALAEAMSDKRERPLYGPPDQRASHSIASVRLLQRRVGMKPFQARRKVVILADAERLVVQEASLEAANALLKVLEEPPADTTVLVTAASPQALLPTIRSRMVPIPLRPLPESEVRAFFAEVTGQAGTELDQTVERSHGTIGRGLRDSDGNTAERAAEQFLLAVTKGPAAWSERALAQPPWDARGGYTEMLDALSRRLRRKAQAAATQRGGTLTRYVQALQLVERRRAEAQGNINPQTALALLAEDLERLR